MEKKKEWAIAQEKITKYIEKLGFDVWKERRINNKRVDILAKKVSGDKIIYLVFEIKHYNRVHAYNEREFFLQIQDYVKELLLREVARKSAKKVLRDYLIIGYLVFTNDFGIFKNRKKDWKKGSSPQNNKIIKEIWKRKVSFFYSTPEFIKKNLESVGISLDKQLLLNKFFDSKENK
ncbi:MAG: hypothetical protein K9W46_06310 [Candidatus Heimdallarchaeum endolithica]|uniref:Uncharacterized protein n=1 Tax=Candidatus Heimdallarchaeum endolithica TaxID=2876572 RepID=A0A9Y1BTN7_9ARCH|nr:MAG: hypothetical protein K9W46_06310 [Candidatus Heimdallarchaeum endolithica]